ncbi:MAG: hypothetical protein ACR2KW_07220 [Rubrobacter sp.]
MKWQSTEDSARWIESLAKKVSEDPQACLSKLDGKVYLTGVGDKYAPELRRLSDTLLNEGGWAGKLSGDYVEQEVLGILLELVDRPTDARVLPFLERLSEALDSHDEQRTVYLALSGIEMTDVDELCFGEVILKRMTEVQKDKIVGGLDAEEDKERFLGRVRTVPFAEMTVSAEPIRAWQIAVDRLSDVLDLLRYSMSFLSNENLDPDINLLGQNASSPPLVAVCGNKVEDLFGSFRDLPTLLKISKEAVRKMEDAGFFEAAEFAGKEDKTQLERKVLRGIQWASDSQGQREYDNKLMSLVISLECLLPSTRASGTSFWTAEGAALLLGRDLKARKAVRNRILGLYKKRNNIVHGGEGEEITADDVVWLRKTVHDLIRTIIKRRSEFESADGVYTVATWLENRKLADGTA